MGSSLGKLFTVTAFGESHGRCVGMIIDGCPAGLAITEEDIQKEVDKRRPGAGGITTARAEEDKVEILSGIFNGRATGVPICLLVWNKNVDSSEYEKTRSIPRPGHADYTAFVKYGGFNDFRGGGRFSGRITVALVMAGAMAKKLLSLIGVDVLAYTVEIGGIKAQPQGLVKIRENVEKNPLKCADPAAAEEMSHITGETSSGVQRQRSETELVATAMNEMTATVQEVARNAESAAEAGHSADEQAEDGKQVVQQTVSAIDELAGEVEKAAEVIQRLEKDSEP